MGPSITHLFESYFVRMKFSIFASDGTCPGASLASQYLFARAFPHTSTLCSCSSVHESRSTDLTLLMCVPIPRWMPEQRMQTKIPKFQLAHRGSGEGVSNANSSYPSLYKGYVSKLLTFIPLAIRAALIPLQFQETFDSLRIAGSPLRGGVHRPSRHFERSRICRWISRVVNCEFVDRPNVFVVDLGADFETCSLLLLWNRVKWMTRYCYSVLVSLAPRSWNLALWCVLWDVGNVLAVWRCG